MKLELLMTPRQAELRRKILEIKSIMPDDNLIRSYSDFLKLRTILSAYKFNKNTYSNLVRLTVELWQSGQSISRPSLLAAISSYGGNNHKDNQVDFETGRRLYFLFHETNINDLLSYSQDTIARMRGCTNKALKGIHLTKMEISELIKNVDRSIHILNRILRYPMRDSIITEWVRNIFLNDHYRERRPELIAWILDEDEEYTINNDVLADDFEFIFSKDKKKVEEFKCEYYAYITATEENQRNMEDRKALLETPDWMNDFPPFGLERPALRLQKRIYNKSIEVEGDPHLIIPDFNNRRRDFYTRIDFYKRLTMLWGVAYSHQKKQIKTKLYKRYYTSELYPAALKIGSRTKNIQFLEWLYENSGK